MKILWVWIGLVFFNEGIILSRADELHPLYRGARAQAMGGAFTAIADDEEAIFYNPAGLAGVKKFAFNVLNIDADVASDAIGFYPKLQSTLTAQDASAVNLMMGQHLYARVQATSTLIVPGFGVAGIYDQQAAVRLLNETLPTGTVGRTNTYGGQAAIGIPIASFGKKKGELRWGVAGKMLWRSGNYTTPTLTDLLTLNSINIMNAMNGTTGSGFGFDSGLQLVYHASKTLDILSGVAMTDIGDTAFSGEVLSQKSNLTYGIAGRLMSKDMIATLSYDYAHFFEPIDWKKKTHLGMELKFPILSLYGGLNETNVTYGAGIDFWLVSVMYVSYAEELSSLAGIDSERRHMVHASVKLDL